MQLDAMIPLITGSGGALVVLSMWIWSERKQRAAAEERYEAIAREAIECLAKIVDAKDDDRAWKAQVISLLETIRSIIT